MKHLSIRSQEQPSVVVLWGAHLDSQAVQRGRAITYLIGIAQHRRRLRKDRL